MLDAAGQKAIEVVAMERFMEKRAQRGRIWKVMGNEQFIRGMWEYNTLETRRSKKDFSGSFSGKTRRDTRSVAAGISFLRGLEQVKKSALWPPNDAARSPCNEEW